MDFIKKLPLSSGFDTILIVINWLTKFGHSIPLTHSFSAKHIAQKFLEQAYKLHRLLESIVIDRDKIFARSALESSRTWILSYSNLTWHARKILKLKRAVLLELKLKFEPNALLTKFDFNSYRLESMRILLSSSQKNLRISFSSTIF